jgi:spore maturation protein SpmA
MVAFMATLIGYIYNQFTGKNLSVLDLTLIGVVFTIVTGYIVYRGITGCTFTSAKDAMRIRTGEKGVLPA